MEGEVGPRGGVIRAPLENSIARCAKRTKLPTHRTVVGHDGHEQAREETNRKEMAVTVGGRARATAVAVGTCRRRVQRVRGGGLLPRNLPQGVPGTEAEKTQGV